MEFYSSDAGDESLKKPPVQFLVLDAGSPGENFKLSMARAIFWDTLLGRGMRLIFFSSSTGPAMRLRGNCARCTEAASPTLAQNPEKHRGSGRIALIAHNLSQTLTLQPHSGPKSYPTNRDYLNPNPTPDVST